ncbi:MAG: hypothetical protein OSB67_11505, partial [Alphaproteobacteria bacterium]|nr:hypothetical protein [Alphaproteobacteria bacterium]
MATVNLTQGTAGAPLADPIFGKLTWEIFPFEQPILLLTFIGVVIGGTVLFAAITYFRLWGY